MCYFSVDDFVFLNNKPAAGNVQRHFDCRVRCLLGAVNQLPIMRLVQPLRKGITGVNPKSPDAFDLGDSNLVKYTSDGHWYVFTTGFREMAQYNIGMYGDYLRVGIGFNISRNNAGPNVGQNVANSFNRFKNFVVSSTQMFQSIASKLSTYADSFRIEYGPLPLLPPEANFVRNVQPNPANFQFMHNNNNYGSSEWFFIGAILLPNNYTWQCSQPCGGVNSVGGIDLLDIVEHVFRELFPYLW